MMRHSLFVVSALGLVFSWGCRPPDKGATETKFKSEVRRYFSNLNSENELRREAMTRERDRSERSPVFQPPAGFLYSTYVFDADAFVVTNFKCRACGVKLMVLVPALEYLCPSCHHSPYLEHQKGTDLTKSPCTQCVGPDHKTKPPEDAAIQRKKFDDLKGEGVVVKDMFEITQGETTKPMEATVRYIRRSWVWDRRGVVNVSQKAIEKAGSSSSYIPVDGGDQNAAPGFYRLESSYLGEVKFKFKGGVMEKVGGPQEEAVRQWKDLQTIK